jgi:hypothetical protein
MRICFSSGVISLLNNISNSPFVALVWPEEDDRLNLLRQALAIAREAPPKVTQGDLRVDLPALAAQAPSQATLVIYHSAVLAYIQSAAERMALANAICSFQGGLD